MNLIRERLLREAEDDVSLKVSVGKLGSNKIEIAGRGDLHLGILMEKMRREGFEMAVTPPEVLLKEENGKKLEPFEELTIECDIAHTSMIIDRLNGRKAILLSADDVQSTAHEEPR